MSEDYIKYIFDVIDGKVKFDKIDQKKRGRKPGYKHSAVTREKIADRMRNRVKSDEIRDKISSSLKGRSKPEEVKDKISKAKTKHTISADLLNQYTGRIKEKDVSMSTAEWLERCGHSRKEIKRWIEENYEAFNDCDDICTESYLKALSIKEEAILEEYSQHPEDWR